PVSSALEITCGVIDVHLADFARCSVAACAARVVGSPVVATWSLGAARSGRSGPVTAHEWDPARSVVATADEPRHRVAALGTPRDVAATHGVGTTHSVENIERPWTRLRGGTFGPTHRKGDGQASACAQRAAWRRLDRAFHLCGARYLLCCLCSSTASRPPSHGRRGLA